MTNAIGNVVAPSQLRRFAPEAQKMLEPLIGDPRIASMRLTKKTHLIVYGTNGVQMGCSTSTGRGRKGTSMLKRNIENVLGTRQTGTEMDDVPVVVTGREQLLDFPRDSKNLILKAIDYGWRVTRPPVPEGADPGNTPVVMEAPGQGDLKTIALSPSGPPELGYQVLTKIILKHGRLGHRPLLEEPPVPAEAEAVESVTPEPVSSEKLTSSSEQPVEAEPSKRCSHCKLVKPLSAFGVHRKAKDGLQSWCKQCQRGRRRSIADEARAVAENPAAPVSPVEQPPIGSDPILDQIRKILGEDPRVQQLQRRVIELQVQVHELTDSLAAANWRADQCSADADRMASSLTALRDLIGEVAPKERTDT